jgi:hypothetical protein
MNDDLVTGHRSDLTIFFSNYYLTGPSALFHARGDSWYIWIEQWYGLGCMFEPIRARLASSCSRNGISAALMPTI